MSWLGRLFGARSAPLPEPAPNSVLVDEELARRLTESGAALDVAVDSALRAYLDAQAKAATGGQDEGIPFWLRRDAESGGDIDSELRDRVINRRAADEESASGAGRTPSAE
jgi:hypothetical protein